jgi:signal transduction histidine kinase
MTGPAAQPYSEREMRDGAFTGTMQRIWDPVLGLACRAVAEAVHLGGTEAVGANLDPSPFSVLLTALAVGPLVVRRRYPLAVLVLTLLGLLALVATRNTVGASTIGCTVAFYTAVAVGSRREARVAVTVMVVGIAVGLLMRPVDLSSGGALVTVVLFTGAGVLGSGVRERRERFEADVVASRERAARSAADERLRITRELHDIIGHAMGVMVVQAGVAERLLESDPDQARTALAQIGDTGRASLAEMRQVLGTLRESEEQVAALPRSPMPTLADLPALVEQMRSAGLPVTLSLEDLGPVPVGVDLAAYRIVQESLTNCLKHADATEVSVRLTRDQDGVRVLVIDDGRSRPDPSPDGQGLSGMRERVAVYGGELAAGPVAGGGFRVEATFPVGAPG